jgi:hypothetical protein
MGNIKIKAPCLVAFVALVAMSAFAQTQPLTWRSDVPLQQLLEEWSRVKQDEAGLVLSVRSDKLGFVFVGDTKGSTFEARPWRSDAKYIRQFRVKPGNYTILINRVPGTDPVNSVTVFAKPGQLTYVDVEGSLNGAAVGARVGRVNPDLAATLQAASQAGVPFQPTYIEPVGNVIQVSTEPPWPVPPPPPKK